MPLADVEKISVDILEDENVLQKEQECMDKVFSLSSATTPFTVSIKIIKEMSNTNSPVHWRSQLINLLKNNGYEYDESAKKLTYINKQILDVSENRQLNAIENEKAESLNDRKWDVFICHASEDKEAIASPLAKKLKHLGINVWYDEFTLDWGSNIMVKIDRGLANSKFGIIILSETFFSKIWPINELSTLFTINIIRKRSMLLPLLHGVTRDYLIVIIRDIRYTR